MCPSNLNWNNWNCHTCVAYCLLGLVLLYKACQSLAKLYVNFDYILCCGYSPFHMHGLEVGAQRAIVASGDRYVLTVKHLRIALSGRLGWQLDKCKVLIVHKLLAQYVATQHAQIVLTSLRHSIVAKHCLQIHANMRVGFQPFFIIIHYSILSGKASASHEGPSAQPRK